jgi:predicted Zn finger-like uncharacterized protein
MLASPAQASLKSGPMILICPACDARYRIADTAVPLEGRMVRCASCKHGWFQPGAEAVADATSEPSPVAEWMITAPASAPAAAAPPSITPALPRANPSLIPLVASIVDAEPTPAKSGWLITLLAMVAGLVLTILAASVWNTGNAIDRLRELPLVGEWLPNATPQPSKLIISVTAQLRVLPGGKNMMALTGMITNPTKTDQPVPPISAQVLDSVGHPVESWIIPAPIVVLPAGRTIGFDSAANNIASSATELSVNFIGSPPQR